MHETPVRMSPDLAHQLKPHQLGGVRFMWENLIGGSVMQSGNQGAGCILAHSMGTGKTLQVRSSLPSWQWWHARTCYLPRQSCTVWIEEGVDMETAFSAEPSSPRGIALHSWHCLTVSISVFNGIPSRLHNKQEEVVYTWCCEFLSVSSHRADVKHTKLNATHSSGCAVLKITTIHDGVLLQKDVLENFFAINVVFSHLWEYLSRDW